MTSVTGVPPGWYDDPVAPATSLRYWDGAAWTTHVAARPVLAAAAPAYAPSTVVPGGPPLPARTAHLGDDPHDALHWIVPTGRSWQTVLAGYLGLAALVFFCFVPLSAVLGVAAIVVGVLGLRAADRQDSHGRIRAVFGIGAGALAIVVAVAIVVLSR